MMWAAMGSTPKLQATVSHVAYLAVSLLLCGFLVQEARSDEAQDLARQLGVEPGTVLQTLGSASLRAGHVTAIAFSPDGRRVAANAWGKIRIWDVSSGHLLDELPLDGNHNPNSGFLEFTADGRSLVSGELGWCPWIHHLDGSKAERLGEASRRPGFPLAISADRSLLSHGEGGTVILHDLRAGREVGKVAPGGPAMIPGLSADGKLLALGESDHRSKASAIHIWDTSSLRELYQLGVVQRPISHILFSPDSKTLYVVDNHAEIQAWDLVDRKLLWQKQPFGNESYGTGSSFALSGDGRLLALSGYGYRTAVLETATQTRVHLFEHDFPEFVRALAFSPDGRTLAAGGDFEVVDLWDLTTGKQRLPLRGHSAGVKEVVVSPDSQSIATLDQKNELLLWNRSGEIVARKGFVRFGLEFSGDGKHLLAMIDDGIAILDGRSLEPLSSLDAASPLQRMFACSSELVCTAELLRGNAIWIEPGAGGQVMERNARPGYLTLCGHKAAITFLALSNDGMQLASSDAQAETIVWDTCHGKEKVRLKGHQKPVNAICFNSNGTRLAAAALDSSVRVWQLPGGEQVDAWQLEDGQSHALSFAPTGKHLAVGLDDGRVQIWDVAARTVQHTLSKAPVSPVTQVSWAPGGRRIVIGYLDGTLKFWSWLEGDHVVESHQLSKITAISWINGEKWLATGDANGRVLVWLAGADAPAAEITGIREPIAGAGVDARGPELEIRTMSGGTYRVAWTNPTGKLPSRRRNNGISYIHDGRKLKGREFARDDVGRFTLSPDGKWLASTSPTALMIRDLDQQRQLPDIYIPNAQFHDLSFSADSQRLAISGPELSVMQMSDGRLMQFDGESSRFGPAIQFSPTENLLLSLWDSELRIWDVDSRGTRKRFACPMLHKFAPSPDGATVVGLKTGLTSELIVFELSTGLPLFNQPLGRIYPTDFALLDEGRKAVVVDNHGLGTVWTLLPIQTPRVKEVPRQNLESWWKDLACDDGPRIYLAQWSLVGAGDVATEWMESHLRPDADEPIAQRVQRLIGQLSGAPQSSRDASSELLRLRPAADNELRLALLSELNPSVRERIELLLAADILPSSSDLIRPARATQVLGRIGTPRAKALLERLASGNVASLQTETASRALSFLRRRKATDSTRR